MSSLVPERPTLPPLRSLALPMHGVPSKMTSPGIQTYNDTSRSQDPQAWQRSRRGSISSPTSLHAPCPLPPLSIAGPLPSMLYHAAPYPPHPHQTTNPAEPHVRLVLTDSLESADAALVLFTTGGSNVSGPPRIISSPDALASLKPGAPLLVVGPALERIRRPGMVLGKGVRMHPYRIAPSPGTTSHTYIPPGTTYAPRK